MTGLVLAGRWYEITSQRRFQKRYPPPGRLFDVNGRKMHMISMGERKPGQPLIVLEAGHGSWSSCWEKVMPELSRHARVCAYDRAGYGWSEPFPGPARPERMAADLYALLQAAGESGPFLLVGHSMGGALARLFATLHPEEVVGMVWVDSVQEDFPPYLPVGRWAFSALRYGAVFGAWMAEIGLVRASGIGRIIARYPSVDDPFDAAAVIEQVSRPGYLRIVAQETDTLTYLPGWRQVQRHFDKLPVISLEALYPHAPAFALSSAVWSRFRAGWHRMHDDLSVRAAELQRIPVSSGHVIMNEQPEMVVEAILSMLNRLHPVD